MVGFGRSILAAGCVVGLASSALAQGTRDIDWDYLPGGMELSIGLTSALESNGEALRWYDYHFTFENGRRIVAGSAFSDDMPDAALILLCLDGAGSFYPGLPASPTAQGSCEDWPEVRAVAISLFALGYTGIVLAINQHHSTGLLSLDDMAMSKFAISHDDVLDFSQAAASLNPLNIAFDREIANQNPSTEDD